MEPATTERVAVHDMEDFIARALTACGLSLDDSRKVGSLMAEADRIGADSHGVFRLPQYVARIRAGGINPTPNIRTVMERPASALLDGDNAMGHLVMSRAAEFAATKARITGVAWVGARFSNHAGPAALYAKMPLDHDMIGLYVAVGSANHLPPWGGTDMLLSTNPIAVAVPSHRKPPIILDMATTVAAYGKVKSRAKSGEPLPQGWMIDRQGRPLTDPKRADEGFLLPIGGPKGYGLALIFGLLAGTLNGAAFGRDVVDFNADSRTVTNTGQFIVAVDISAFADVEEFKHDVDSIWSQMKGSDRLPGFEEIRLPGEGLHQRTSDNTEYGIPLTPTLRSDLDDLARDLGIDPL